MLERTSQGRAFVALVNTVAGGKSATDAEIAGACRNFSKSRGQFDSAVAEQKTTLRHRQDAADARKATETKARAESAKRFKAHALGK